MSRPENGRGARPLRGLALVFGLLVFFVLYVAWRDSIPLTSIPSQLLAAPLWFYVVLVIASAAFVAAMRARQQASSVWTPSDVVPAPDTAEYGTSDDAASDASQGPPSTPDRAMPEFAPVARSYPWEGRGTEPAAQPIIETSPRDETSLSGETSPSGENNSIPELDTNSESVATADGETVQGGQARPDKLLSRLMNWLDATSPDSLSKRFSR